MPVRFAGSWLSLSLSLFLFLSLSLCIPDGVVSVEKQSWFYSGELPWQENDDRTDAIVT